MTYIFQFILSFFASFSFGILFNAPRRVLLHCGLAGAVGWVIYFTLSQFEVDSVLATFFGAVGLTVVSIYNARILRVPILTFITCGIIPLVPGGRAYESMRHIVLSDYMRAFEFGFEAALIAMAIAFGIIFAEMSHSVLQTAKNKILKRKRL
ncbi:threonine/serine exporter family protein [Corticicoccus populi]|uniref:Threonine/serine exporter family protein n=1 Tax=Corticicoccus populi TaxID=1812821 RepID=A0ABW5WTV4_9STAP